MRSFVYGYSHLLIFAGITLAGVGIEAAIMADAEHPFTVAARLALGGGLAAFLLGVGVVRWAAPRSLPGAVLASRLLGALVCVALVFVDSLSPLLLCLLMLAVLTVQLAFGSRYESRHPTVNHDAQSAS